MWQKFHNMTSKTQSTKNKLINWILSKCIKYALQKTGMRQDRRKPLQKHISKKELISRRVTKNLRVGFV